MSAVTDDTASPERARVSSRDRPEDAATQLPLTFELQGLEIDVGIDGATRLGRSARVASRATNPPRLGPFDLTLRGGQLVGLVGPSGIGKTSLLRASCGLSERAVRGRLRLGSDTLVCGTRAADRWFARARGGRLAWISAHGAASLDPRRTLGAQARELLRWFGAPNPNEPSAAGERAATWASLGLDAASVLGARPDELSIGQGHRAALALALLASPEVLLVDEPAAALDDVTAALVWDRLRDEAHGRGHVVVVVDHDLDRVLQRCDRVVVLAHDDTTHRVSIGLDADASSVRAAIAGGHAPSCLRALDRGISLPLAARASARHTPEGPSPTGLHATAIGSAPRLELRAVEPPHVTPALREQPFDLVLRRGEIHALLGPSGIGKTSLLHVAVGLLRFVSGAALDNGIPRPAHVFGLSVANAPALFALRKVTQLVWQDSARALDPHHDVATALRAPAQHAGASLPDDAALDAALEEVGLGTAIRDRPLGTLSGGERQRVAIQRALLARPELLVLDEPTAHLDAPRIAWLVTRLQAERDAGTAILLATHDRRFAAALGAIVHDLGVRASEPMPPWLDEARPAEPVSPEDR